MGDPLAGVLDPFLAEADAALGDRYTAVLYGSAARGDFAPGRSSIDLILLLDEATPGALRALARALDVWRKARLEPPLLLSRAEWARATDVFPVEIADMQTAYRVLRGADPIPALQVERTDLRRALEREFRGKLLRLRQGYAALAPDPLALGTLAGQSASTLLVLYRALLVLLRQPVPSDPLALVSAATTAAGVPGGALAAVVANRRARQWRCSPEVYEEYLDGVERTTRFLDQLQLGD